MHTYEIYDLQTTAQLIILSGCNTGIGQWQRGEGMQSLERAFQYGGCPSLLTSLWTVDDAATSDLSSLFLTNLKNGMPKDQALQSGMISFLDQANPEKLHPFYWSSLKMVGNIDQLEKNKSGWKFLVLAIAIALTAIFFKRRFTPKNS